MAQTIRAKNQMSNYSVTSAINPDGTTTPLYRIYPARQCRSKSISHQCQGVSGHSGAHWCYSADGSFEQWVKDGGHSSCPPGHKNYVSPEQMAKYYFVRFAKYVPYKRVRKVKEADHPIDVKKLERLSKNSKKSLAKLHKSQHKPKRRGKPK